MCNYPEDEDSNLEEIDLEMYASNIWEGERNKCITTFALF